MSENKNMKLWESVERTDPAYTKPANVKGNRITAIAPQYQLKCATEVWGAYGGVWGLRELKWDYDLAPVTGFAVLSAVFYYPSGQFEITNAASLYTDGARTKPDTQFAKKCETDTLTKALSKLGFNADIFLGLFDDHQYVNDITEDIYHEKEEAKAVELIDAKTVRNVKNYTKQQGFSHEDMADMLQQVGVEDVEALTGEKLASVKSMMQAKIAERNK